EEGLLGTILLLTIMIIIFRNKTRDTYQYVQYIIIAGLIGVAVFAFFSYPMQILPIKLVLVILLALLATLDNKKWQYKFKKSNTRVLVLGRVASLCFLFFALFKGFAYTKTINQAFQNWQTAFVNYSYSDYESALENYRKAYPVLRKDGDFLMNYGKTLTMA